MKIFCIGLSRTGTTSMSSALTTLGYKVLHYPDTEDVVMKTLTKRFDWDVLDEYDAFADVPVAAFYKELDKQSPGSKFILTTRDLDLWLNSCKRKIKSPRSRYVNPTTHLVYSTAIRTILFSRPYYSREHFIDAYYRHFWDVNAHFSYRPEDLLVMNVKQGWEPLCKFLAKPIPKVDFPKLRKSTGVYK